MWRFKQFIPSNQATLEGKSVDVGSFKLQIRSIIAEGGFSSVYLAKDSITGKNYAVKHIISNDEESLDLVRKEVSVMKSVRGHPNIVMLHTQAMYDMARTKECFLVMDFCEKTLVQVLDARGAGYFEEKHLLLTFRDICNALYGLHCQTPPIAHRDLKAENMLLGPDGLWKLCDFGSTSTTHKRFEKAGEMGVEEDIIRKHTTPAYRAPEMWDLYRRELISEKVDIWALGCLLYRLAYLKSAFDGESKLQILNGNYKIPDVPRYSSTVTELIRDMLTANPESRPDALQIWHRVNNSLPIDCQKSFPDRPPSSSKVEFSTQQLSDTRSSNLTKNLPALPSRAPPPVPPSKDVERHSPQTGGGGRAGAFWSTQYAQETQHDEDASERKLETKSPTISRDVSPVHGTTSENEHHPPIREVIRNNGPKVNKQKKTHDSESSCERLDDKRIQGYEVIGDRGGFKQDKGTPNLSVRTSYQSNVGVSAVSNSSSNVYNEFVSQLESPANLPHESSQKTAESSHLELEGMREALRQALAEKDEVAAKYEKLTAICRSQRQEIQDLKATLKATTGREASYSSAKSPPSYANMQPLEKSNAESWQAFGQAKSKEAGSIWELQEGLSDPSSGAQIPDNFKWQAFGDSAIHQSATHQSKNTRIKGGIAVASTDSTFGTAGGSTAAHNQRQTMSSSESKREAALAFAPETKSYGDSKPFLISTASALTSSSAHHDGIYTKRDLKTGRSKKPAGWAGF